jgi:hypothetical protein
VSQFIRKLGTLSIADENLRGEPPIEQYVKARVDSHAKRNNWNIIHYKRSQSPVVSQGGCLLYKFDLYGTSSEK